MNMLQKLRKFIRSTIGKISAVVFLTLLSVVAGNLFASTKVISAPASKVSCPPALEGQIYRFIEGMDKCLVPLSKSETAKLNDPFAKKLLRQGIFPDGVPDMDKKLSRN